MRGVEYLTLTKQKNIVTSKNISTEEWYSKGEEVEILRNRVNSTKFGQFHEKNQVDVDVKDVLLSAPLLLQIEKCVPPKF